MEKVEQFIQANTKTSNNTIIIKGRECNFVEYKPWLTPDQARQVAKIAREETVNEVCKWIIHHYGNYMHNPTGKQLEAFFGMDMVGDLKKHLEDKA